MLLFQVGTTTRRKTRKTAASPQSLPKVARPGRTQSTYRKPKAQTLNERDKHTMQRKRTELKTKPEMKRATKADLLTVPTNVPSRPPTSPKSKTSMEPTIPMMPQMYQRMGDYVFEGDMSSTITELKTDANLPPPIEIDFSMHQTGSSTRLNKYRKMYPSTTYEIPKQQESLKPFRTLSTQDQIQESSVCGFGRTGIFWPYSWYDWCKAKDQTHRLKTCQQSCFNRTQIEDTIRQMYDDAWENVSPPITFNAFLKELEQLKGGDQAYSFPMDSISSQFKYVNRNVQLPLNISVYICTPKKDLPEINTPQADWFNPWSIDPSTAPLPSSNSLSMRPDYFYNPAVTGQENVAVTGTSPTVSQVTMKENVDNLITISTEVVKEATPSGFSELFNENWEILTVKKVRLTPGQELVLNLHTHLSKPLNLERFLGDSRVFDGFDTLFRHQSYAGLTLFPMIRFYGDDVAGTSAGLSKVPFPAGDRTEIKNRVFQSTAPRSGPALITGTQTVKSRVSVPAAPLSGESAAFNGTRSIESVLMNFSTKARNLFKYNAPERGQQCPYWKINDFCEYFVGKDPNVSGTKYTEIVEVSPRTGGTPIGENPSWSNVTLLNPKDSKDWVEIDVSSTRQLRTIRADVGTKNDTI